ncbi:hypothetical protein K1Y78_59335, partial [Streptomyces sp. tea 10]|nr:hypothetical protein [Streptomyces sp. tea 10]
SVSGTCSRNSSLGPNDSRVVVSFNIDFGGISILQSQSFGTLTLSLTGSDESVDRAVESLRAVTTVREVSE